jgi:hypothetical protein
MDFHWLNRMGGLGNVIFMPNINGTLGAL